MRFNLFENRLLLGTYTVYRCLVSFRKSHRTCSLPYRLPDGL